MTVLVTKLPSLDAEQFNLPGLGGLMLSTARLQPPAAADPADGFRPIPGPDQLHFGANQEPLTEPPAVARQLPLLPDPPPWEAEPSPGPRRRRSRPAKRRESLSPGQMSLF